jgi:hypothetical protein
MKKKYTVGQPFSKMAPKVRRNKMPDLTPENREDVLDWMRDWRIEPYWDISGPPEERVLFRSIPGSRGLYHFRSQRERSIYPKLRYALSLQVNDDTLQERVKTVRAEVRRRAGLQGAPFG